MRVNKLYSEQARMSAGREFQIVGAATRKLGLLIVNPGYSNAAYIMHSQSTVSGVT